MLLLVNIYCMLVIYINCCIIIKFMNQISGRELEILIRLHNAGLPLNRAIFIYNNLDANQSLVSYLNSLITKGFVRETNSTFDKREISYELTQEGKDSVHNFFKRYGIVN